MVLDYRRLNEATIPDVYPLPLFSQLTRALTVSKVFSSMRRTDGAKDVKLPVSQGSDEQPRGEQGLGLQRSIQEDPQLATSLSLSSRKWAVDGDQGRRNCTNKENTIVRAPSIKNRICHPSN